MQNLHSNSWRVSTWTRKDVSCMPVSRIPALLLLEFVTQGQCRRVSGRQEGRYYRREDLSVLPLFCTGWCPPRAAALQRWVSVVRGEANICNQDVGNCTFQNVLQIKLCLSFWCSFPILMRLQLFSFLFFLRWPHTFEKAHPVHDKHQNSQEQ